MTKNDVQRILDQAHVAVVATFGAVFPEAAAIDFARDGMAIIFNTLATSRKARNIESNQNVSLVIGWSDRVTVQYEGVATPLLGDELERAKELYFAKYPEDRAWTFQDVIYFRVDPKWIRLTDLHTFPWKTADFSF